jgi:hypothetical protein
LGEAVSVPNLLLVGAQEVLQEMLLKIALEMIISPEKSLDLDLVANAIDGSESRR